MNVEKQLVKIEKYLMKVEKSFFTKSTMLQSQAASIKKLCNAYANSTFKCDVLVGVKLLEDTRKSKNTKFTT